MKARTIAILAVLALAAAAAAAWAFWARAAEVDVVEIRRAPAVRMLADAAESHRRTGCRTRCEDG